jgi:hypothetical protein
VHQLNSKVMCFLEDLSGSVEAVGQVLKDKPIYCNAVTKISGDVDRNRALLAVYLSECKSTEVRSGQMTKKKFRYERSSVLIEMFRISIT